MQKKLDSLKSFFSLLFIEMLLRIALRPFGANGTTQCRPVVLSEWHKKLVKEPAFYACTLEAAHWRPPGHPLHPPSLHQSLATMLRAMTAEEGRVFLGDLHPPSQEKRVAMKRTCGLASEWGSWRWMWLAIFWLCVLVLQ